MAGKTVDLKFRADLSHLISEMKSLPGMTEGEAKKMAASLERQIKKAEKASTKAANATKKAWEAQRKALKKTGPEIDKTTAKFKKLEGAGGETSSVLGGVAGALSLVSPEAGAAAQGLADASGGLEMVARSGPRLIGVLAPVAAAAAVAGLAFQHYSKDLAAAEARMAAASQKAAMMGQIFGKIKTARARAELELAVLKGEEGVEQLTRFNAEQQAASEFSEGLAASTKNLTTARQTLSQATGKLEGMEAALARSVVLHGGRVNDETIASARRSVAGFRVQEQAITEQAAAVASATHVQKIAIQLDERVRGGQEKQVETLVELVETKQADIKVTKASTRSTKEVLTELQKLNEQTKAMLPDSELSRYEELTEHLDRLKAAAGGSQKAAAALAGSIEATTIAIADLNAKRAADELAAMVAEIDKLAPAATISRMAELEAAQRLINDAIANGGDEAEELGRKLAQVNAAIREESAKTKAAIEADQADQAKKAKAAALELKNAYLSAYGSINSAASMVADEVLARAEEAAAAEIDSRQEAVDKTESLLADALAHRDSLRDQEQTAATRREIAATNARIEQLGAGVEAERAALETTRELQNQAIQRAFRAQQALRIAEITMNTAGAIMNAANSVPTPAFPFVAAGLVALGATQAALVGSQEPPTMHLGGIVGGPDERTITARAGEGVLTRQGVNAIGGEAGVASANRGQGGGAMVVQMVYKHRVLDEVLTDSVRRGGPIGSAINRRSPRGRRNPHGRRAS